VDQHRLALNGLSRRVVAALAAAPLLFVSIFYAWPVGTLLWSALRGRSGSATPFTQAGGILWFTLWQAVLSTALTLLIGFMPTYVLARYRFPGRSVVTAIATVPFVLPTVVVGSAFLALLPDSWHGTPQAMIIAHVFFNIAVVVRLVGSMIAVIPHDLVAAAETLGASPARATISVLLPLVRPALWSAASVIFLFSFTSYGVATLLGGPLRLRGLGGSVRRATWLHRTT
jgi:thiamine transport system permease protein